MTATTTDPRIGILIREGTTIYYAFHDGKYIERRTFEDMQQCLTVLDNGKRISEGTAERLRLQQQRS